MRPVRAREGARGALGTSLSQIVSLVFNYFLALYLVRSIGTSEYGVYALCVTVFQTVFLLSRFGQEKRVVRYSSAAVSVGNPGAISALLTESIVITAVGSCTVAVVMLVLSTQLGTLFGIERFGVYFTPFALLGTLYAPAIVLGGSLWGLGHVSKRAAAEYFVAPTGRLAATIVLVSLGFGITGAVLGFVIGGVAGVLVIVYWSRRFVLPVLQGTRRGVGKQDFREQRRFALVVWGAEVLNYVGTYGGVIVVGAVLSSTEVGLFNVSLRISVLAMLALTPANMILAPLLASDAAVGDSNGIGRKYRTAARWSFWLSSALIVGMWLQRMFILGMFGSEFQLVAGGFSALLAAKLIETGIGTPGQILSFTGYHRLEMVNTVGFVVLSMVLTGVLGMHYGVRGALVGTAVGIATANLIRMFEVHYLYGFWPFSWSYARVAVGLLVGVALYLLGLRLLPFAADAGIVQFGWCVICLTIALLAEPLLGGLSEEERSALRRVVPWTAN